MITEVAVPEDRDGQQVGSSHDLMKGLGSFTMLSSGIWGLGSALGQPLSTYSLTYFPQSLMPSPEEFVGIYPCDARCNRGMRVCDSSILPLPIYGDFSGIPDSGRQREYSGGLATVIGSLRLFGPNAMVSHIDTHWDSWCRDDGGVILLSFTDST